MLEQNTMADAVYILSMSLLYMFFKCQIKTNNNIVDYFVLFTFEFVISFMLMSGNLVVHDWVNNVDLVLLPNFISFFVGFVFMLLMLFKAFVFAAKELKVMKI